MAPKRATRSTPVTTTPAPTATTTTSVTNAQLQAMIDQGVTAALAARDANRNGDDSHTSQGTRKLLNKCNGSKGWDLCFFRISNCPVENQVKFSTCTLLAGALTWWNSHVMTGTDVIGYNQRFQELALLCVRMFPEESDKIERYVGGLPDMIHGNIVASKPKTMQEAVEMATELMDKKVITLLLKRQMKTKRKLKQHYPETIKTNNNRTRGRTLARPNTPCKRNWTNPDSNIVTGTFLLNNRYASILFDTGADRSFVSTAFSSQMDITPSTLDHYYDVELADGRIIGLNTILRGCTLNLLNHPFNINLMPVELGSFDAIIGMDWLAKYQAIIVCAEKIVRIP
ncbi:reverse transcriptase domain-containing protein [Tanacetum coccineum]